MNIKVKYFNIFSYMPDYNKLAQSIRKIEKFRESAFTIFHAIFTLTILPGEGCLLITHRIKGPVPNELILDRGIQDTYEVSQVWLLTGFSHVCLFVGFNMQFPGPGWNAHVWWQSIWAIQKNECPMQWLIEV